VLDQFDNPYGVADNGKEVHYAHLYQRPCAIQNNNVVVHTFFAENIDFKSPSLASNILIPLLAEQLTINGVPLNITEFFTPKNVTLTIGDTFGVRGPNAAAFIKILFSEGCGENPPTIVYQSNPLGIDINTSRISVYHYHGKAISYTCLSKSVVLFYVGSVYSDSDYNHLQTTIMNSKLTRNLYNNSTTTWNVTVEMNGDVYDIQRVISLADRTGSIRSRTINGVEMVYDRIYWVNGVEFMTYLNNGTTVYPTISPLPPPPTKSKYTTASMKIV